MTADGLQQSARAVVGASWFGLTYLVGQHVLRKHPPLIRGLVLTNRCNLRCQHCRVFERDPMDLSFAEVTAAVVRASSGAAEYVRVAQVTNLHQAMLRLKDQDVRLAGLEGTPEATLYTAADLKGPLGLVVGSEGQGLSKLIADTCDALLRIPMEGRVGSLNAGVAAAVALYEARRQRAV